MGSISALVLGAEPTRPDAYACASFQTTADLVHVALREYNAYRLEGDETLAQDELKTARHFLDSAPDVTVPDDCHDSVAASFYLASAGVESAEIADEMTRDDLSDPDTRHAFHNSIEEMRTDLRLAFLSSAVKTRGRVSKVEVGAELLLHKNR